MTEFEFEWGKVLQNSFYTIAEIHCLIYYILIRPYLPILSRESKSYLYFFIWTGKSAKHLCSHLSNAGFNQDVESQFLIFTPNNYRLYIRTTFNITFLQYLYYYDENLSIVPALKRII